MKNIFKRTALVALVAALGLASLSVFGVSAAEAEEPTTPPTGEMTNERLEKLWAREVRAYEKLGKTETFISKTQQLIDRAAEHGMDVSAVQAALDAFGDAVDNAKPIYESAHEIVNLHAGFDADGKVTDAEQARATVRALGEKLKEMKDAMGGTGQALRDALHAFREANPRPEKTPEP